jgi:hypothetical protein
MSGNSERARAFLAHLRGPKLCVSPLLATCDAPPRASRLGDLPAFPVFGDGHRLVQRRGRQCGEAFRGPTGRVAGLPFLEADVRWRVAVVRRVFAFGLGHVRASSLNRPWAPRRSGHRQRIVWCDAASAPQEAPFAWERYPARSSLIYTFFPASRRGISRRTLKWKSWQRTSGDRDQCDRRNGGRVISDHRGNTTLAGFSPLPGAGTLLYGAARTRPRRSRLQPAAEAELRLPHRHRAYALPRWSAHPQIAPNASAVALASLEGVEPPRCSCGC